MSSVLDATHFDGCKVEPLVKAARDRNDFELASCLDMGCGLRTVDQWFTKFSNIPEPRFVGAEVDEDMLAKLADRGIDAVNPLTTSRDLTSDLVMAREVIEHIPADECQDFIDLCARNTRKIFALTTPNFEYWDRLRPTPETQECRWVPDHFKDFRPDSDNPHAHKQEMTPALVGAYLRNAFPDPTWQRRVYRAWPWRLQDLARGTEWTLYFKIFAVVWRV